MFPPDIYLQMERMASFPYQLILVLSTPKFIRAKLTAKKVKHLPTNIYWMEIKMEVQVLFGRDDNDNDDDDDAGWMLLIMILIHRGVMILC